jgi:type IV pilus assembly protein PilF
MRYIIFIFLLLSYSVMADAIHAAKIHSALGFLYIEKGLFEPAKKEFMLAVQEDPHHASSWYGIAYYLEKTGDDKNADIAYRNAIYVEPHSGSAKNNYGAFLCHQKKYNAAIKLFLSAAEEPHYLHAAKAYSNAGVCAMKMPDNVRARQYFTMALIKNPHNQLALAETRRH